MSHHAKIIEQTWLKPEVLVVDDDTAFAEEIVPFVEHSGYICHISSNGPETLEKIYNNARIGIILLDINLPIMNGIEVLEKINSMNNFRRKIQTILMTGNPNADNLVKALDYNIVNYLIKPLSGDKINKELSLAVVRYNEEKYGASESLNDKFSKKLNIFSRAISSINSCTKRNSSEDEFESCLFPKLVGNDYSIVRKKRSNFLVLDQPSSDLNCTNKTLKCIEVLIEANERFMIKDSNHETLKIIYETLLCEIQRKPIAVSALCYASNLPQTTALRKIDELVEGKILEKRQDLRDRRRTYVFLSKTGRERVLAFVDKILSL